MTLSRPAKGDVDLRLAFCGHATAAWAIRRWYYRPGMPIGKLVKIGVWEDNVFSGVVIFGMGSSHALGRRWGLGTFEVCELARLALRPGHKSQVSRVVKIALAMLRRQSPGVRAVVSFADASLHYGGVYQAGGWIYTGLTSPDVEFIDVSGRVWHSRELKSSGVKRGLGGLIHITPKRADCEQRRVPGKHRYVMPLDAATKLLVLPFAKAAPAHEA